MYLLISLTLLFLLTVFMLKDISRGLIFTIVTLFTLDVFGIKGTFPGWPIAIIIVGFWKFRRCGVKCPFNRCFALMFFSYVISWVLGEYNTFPSIIQPVAYILMALLVWNFYKPDKKNNWFLITIIVIYTIINVSYGAYETFTFTKPFREWLEVNNPSWADHEEFHERFGIAKAHGFTKSFTFFALGLIMSLMTMLFLTVKDNVVKYNKVIVYITSALSLLGIIISCDRTSIAAACIALSSMLVLFKSNYRLSLGVTLVLAGVYVYFMDFFELIVFSFTHYDEITGSSVEMRIDQFDAAYRAFKLSPLWGNGLESHDQIAKMFPHILGAESIIFRLFYARGILGIMSSFILYIFTIFFFLKKKCYAILILFLSFLFYNIVTIPVDEIYVYPFLFILYKNHILKKQIGKPVIISQVRNRVKNILQNLS